LLYLNGRLLREGIRADIVTQVGESNWSLPGRIQRELQRWRRRYRRNPLTIERGEERNKLDKARRRLAKVAVSQGREIERVRRTSGWMTW
jgi:hypothetical protein